MYVNIKLQKTHVFFILLSILLSVAIFNACKKRDFDSEIRASNNIVSKFFKHNSNIDPTVKAIIESVKRQNDKRDFVVRLTNTAGYPRWDKAKVSSKDDQKQVFIPFVLEKGNQTRAMLIARLSGEDTLYHLLYGPAYKKYGFDRNIKDCWTAREVISAFAIFDKEIFGHEEFTIKDDRLLGADNNNPDNEPVVAIMKDSIAEQNARSQTSRYLQITVTWVICGTCYARTTDGGCCNATYYSDVVTFWFDDGFGGPSYEWGWYPPEGGGGGGGTPCPGCNWDNTNPCEEQDPNQPQFPCDQDWQPTVNANIFDYYHEWGYTHFETWTVSPEDQAEIEDWRFENIDTSGLDSCRSQILTKLLGSISGNNVLGKILSKMDRSIFEDNNIEKFTWNVRLSNLLHPAVAKLDSFGYDPSSGVFTANTLMDSTKMSAATDIYVAGTFLHEAIHAYMMSVLYRIKNGVTLAQLQAMTYDSVFNEYVDSLTARNASTLTWSSFSPAYHHNLMQGKLLNAIADALKEFDNNSINDDEYYWYIAWKGLDQTDAWLQHWPNYNASPNLPIVGAPYTTNDSTRGMKYALTPTRIVNIFNSVNHEKDSDFFARGRKPINGGCY